MFGPPLTSFQPTPPAGAPGRQALDCNPVQYHQRRRMAEMDATMICYCEMLYF